MTATPQQPQKNSTYVRTLAVGRGLLGPLARVAPGVAAAAAEHLFFTPPRPRRSRGEAVLDRAEPLRIPVDGRRVAAWRWGRGPAVILLHGWGGRAAQLTSFVPALVGRGFSAVAFDAPGHGRSGRGLSSAPQFARALRAVAEALGGAHAVVAHSLGAPATALAMRDGLELEQVVFLGPAADPPAWVPPFMSLLGLGAEVVDRLRARSERRLGLAWSELRVPALAAGLEARLLVVHDRDDAQVPIGDGAAIARAWRGARLVETRGLGHNRVLRDPGVVERVAAFLAEGRPAGCGCAEPAAPLCPRCLEQELFDPGLRLARAGAA